MIAEADLNGDGKVDYRGKITTGRTHVLILDQGSNVLFGYLADSFD